MTTTRVKILGICNIPTYKLLPGKVQIGQWSSKFLFCSTKLHEINCSLSTTVVWQKLKEKFGDSRNKYRY